MRLCMNVFKTVPRRPTEYQAPRNKVSARQKCTEEKWSSWGEGDGSSEQSSSRQSHRMANNTESSLSRSMDLRVSSQWRQTFSSERCLPVKQGEKCLCEGRSHAHGAKSKRPWRDEAHYVRLRRKWQFRVPFRMLAKAPDNKQVNHCFFRKIVCWHLTRNKCMEVKEIPGLESVLRYFRR